MEAVETKEQKKSEVLRNQFTQVCAQIGQAEFQIELLKKAQLEINSQFNEALKAEAPAEAPQA